MDFRQTFSSLSEKEFRLLWFGTLFAQAAMQMNIVARPWLAYHLSSSALALGIVALARGLPQSILSLLGGALADRMDKRNLLVFVQFSLAFVVIINAILVHLDIVKVWHLVVISLLQGVIFAFNMPARQALVPEVVSKERLSNALALNSTGMNLNRVLAPALAGVLIASHPAVAFDAAALFYILSACLLLKLKKVETSGKTSSKRNAFGDIADGLTYIYQNKKLLMLIVMAFVPTMVGMPYQQLLPVFQKDVLHVGPSGLGMMYTVVGIGALFGSLSVASMTSAKRLYVIQGISGILFGVFLMIFAASTHYMLSLVFLAGIGLASQGYMTLNSVLLMNATDAAYYGRVMSVYMLTFSMSPVAMLPIGYLVDRIGVSTTEIWAGIILSVGMLILFFVSSRFWTKQNRMDKKREAGEHAPS